MANEEKTITDHIGTINTTIGGVVKEVLNKVDIPNGGKPVLGVPGKAIDGIVLTDKVAKAPDEKSKFTEIYKWTAGTAGAGGGTILGAKGGAALGFLLGGPVGAGIGGIVGAGIGAAGGNWAGNEFAETTSESAYSAYSTAKEALLNTSYLSLTINPTSSPPVSFKITKAIIKESLCKIKSKRFQSNFTRLLNA